MVFGQGRAVKSHRLGRRRRKGGGRLPVAPWILITLVCVLAASVLTVVYMSLLRAGCGGSVYRVTVAAAPNISSALHEQARAWEQGHAEIDGRCVGVTVESVSAVDAARGLTGQWNQRQLGARPAAWVPDSDVWSDWVTGTEATAGMFSAESVVLGESRAVLAVPVAVAEEFGWTTGARPTWGEILEAAEAGALTVAAASPRSSTEGLQAMLNVVVDADGAIDVEAMQRYSDAVDAGRTGASAEALFSELSAFVGEGGEVEAFATVYTALDYQVDFFNRSSPEALAMVSVEPADARLNAVYPYLVLGGAGWVSEGDAAVAAAFGEFLGEPESREALAAAGFGSSGAEAESLRAAVVVTGETVRAAVRQWQAMRRDLNVLIVVDSSSLMVEDVEWGGEFLSAADAARR
jgi:Ca-activated chloride channel homolog